MENCYGDVVRTELARASLLVSAGRIAYHGVLGAHDERIMGGICIYAAGDRRLTLKREARQVDSILEIVPANEPHAVNSNGGVVTQLILEPETIVDGCVGAWGDCAERSELAQRINRGLAELSVLDQGGVTNEAFDDAFLGKQLPRRQLDRRIRHAVERIVHHPARKHSAERYAREVDLSVSRFSHLFRSETGSTLRGFCAWKRVRAALTIISSEEKLVETALNAGYADSTHFCHAIRQFFGRRPRDILSIVARGELKVYARDGTYAVDPRNFPSLQPRIT